MGLDIHIAARGLRIVYIAYGVDVRGRARDA